MKNKQGGSNLKLPDFEATPKDHLRQAPEPPQLDPKEQAKQDEYWRYRLDPVNDPNSAEYQPDEFACYSRLMRKLNNIKLKAHDEHSEDNLNNSYNIEVSSVSSVEAEEEPDPKDPADASPSPMKKRKPKKPKKKTVKQMMAAMFGKKTDNGAAIKKKARKPVVNVYCTDYEVVKKAAKVYAGFRLKERREDHEGAIVKGIGGQKLAEDWDVSWHDLGITADYFAKMQPYQKVSQFAGIYSITRKNNLARNLMKMKKAFPDEYRFFPRTFIMPGEASEFRNQFTDRHGRAINRRKTFIVKPDNLAQGRGIYLSRNCEKIIEQCTNEGGGWVVQDYLASPHTIEDLKYDLRIYVLLYGLNPLRIYIHEQGLARFATEPYEKPRPNNLDNIYCHLTNYAINKMNDNFKQNNKAAKEEDDYGGYDEEESDDCEEEEEEGHKRSMFAILKILYSQGGDVDKVMGEIKDIVIKTCISGQPYMNHTYRVCQPECMDNSMCFQVLGFDIMIDKNFRPWLIEVNQSPSFSTDSPLDYEIKKAVLKDTFQLLNSSPERREHYIRVKAEAAAERMLKGKTIKLGNEEREARKQVLLEERFEFERQRINEGSGYELIYPPLGDEEREAEFEGMQQKAQDIWDDFTTGKGKRRQEEAKQAEQQKLGKRKSQAALGGEGTPGESRPPEISDSDSDSSHKEQEIVAGTEELLENAGDTLHSEREKTKDQRQEYSQVKYQINDDLQENKKTQAQESLGIKVQANVASYDNSSPFFPQNEEVQLEKPFHQSAQIDSTTPVYQPRLQIHHPSQQILQENTQSFTTDEQDQHEIVDQGPTLDQLCERLDLQVGQEGQRATQQSIQGLEHLQSLAEAHQVNDKMIRAAQRQQLEQLQGKGGLHLGGRKNSKFGDMIQMIKMAQAREEVTNQLLASCVVTSSKQDPSHLVAGIPHAMSTSSPLKSFQNQINGPKGAINLQSTISPVVQISKKQLLQPPQNQTLGGFGKGTQYHYGPQSNQNLLSVVVGDSSLERGKYFNHISMGTGQENWTQNRKKNGQAGNHIPKHSYQGNGNFASLQIMDGVNRNGMTREDQILGKQQKYVSLANPGFDKIASAAYGSSNSNEGAALFPEDQQISWKDNNLRSPQATGMNIQRFKVQQASPMDQFTIARLQNQQSKPYAQKYQGVHTQGQQVGRTSPSVAEGLNQYHNGGQIFLQGQKKVTHHPDAANATSSFQRRVSPGLNRDQYNEEEYRDRNHADELERQRKVSTQPVSHQQLPIATQSERTFDTALVIKPDRIHFQDQSHDSDSFNIPNAPRTIAQKYIKETPQKIRPQAKSQMPQSIYSQQKDYDRSQGQQSIDLEYIAARAQNIKLMKTEAKASQQQSFKGLEYLGATPDGKNHYNYKLKLFSKQGQLTTKNHERQDQIYENIDASKYKHGDNKTNSTANSERFRIAALRDSRRGSLIYNKDALQKQPFALGSSFQAAGQQALFGNIGSSQTNQSKGESLPLHRHSIGPGVVTDNNKQINDQMPKLDKDGNSFYPELQNYNNRQLLHANFATPQQKTSEKLTGAEIEYTTKISKGQTPMTQHPTTIMMSPYETGITNQILEQNGMHRNNTSTSRKQLLVPVLSNNNSQQNIQMMGPPPSLVGVGNENPQYKKQKQASNAIIQQANQILQQVTRNTSQYKETLQFSANGQAVLGGKVTRRNPNIQVNMQSGNPEQIDKELNQKQIYPNDPTWSNPMVGSSYDKAHNNLKLPSDNNIHSNSKQYQIENSQSQPGSMRLHERVQRGGQSPAKNPNSEIQLSPKAIRRPRNISQYEAHDLSGPDDVKNKSVNSHNQGMINVFQHAPVADPNQQQAIHGRQLINKHKNINFANF